MCRYFTRNVDLQLQLVALHITTCKNSNKPCNILWFYIRHKVIDMFCLRFRLFESGNNNAVSGIASQLLTSTKRIECWLIQNAHCYYSMINYNFSYCIDRTETDIG